MKVKGSRLERGIASSRKSRRVGNGQAQVSSDAVIQRGERRAGERSGKQVRQFSTVAGLVAKTENSLREKSFLHTRRILCD